MVVGMEGQACHDICQSAKPKNWGHLNCGQRKIAPLTLQHASTSAAWNRTKIAGPDLRIFRKILTNLLGILELIR